MKFVFGLILSVMAISLTSNSAHAEWWQTVLTCDNGAARVEVDLGERRNVRLVITNADIRKYLSSTRINDLYSSEEIRGRVNNGIFHSSQFRGFTREGVSATCYGGYAATVFIYRDGNGLRVSGRQEGAAGCCYEMDSGGLCTNKGSDVPQAELGNWYFRDCSEQSIAP
jgi:hypothetical protein